MTSIVGNAVFLAEGALAQFFEGVEPDFLLFENMTVKELIDSANDFRDPDDYYRPMKRQADPIWKVDPKNGEITATFFLKSASKDAGDDFDVVIDKNDVSDTHKPEVRFLDVDIRDVDPKAVRKTKRSKYKNMIPLFLPKDPNMDMEQWFATAEDKFETPEEMEKAMEGLFDRYYIEPLTSKTQIAVRCTCQDYHWTFLRANKAKGAHFGKAVGTFSGIKGTGEPRNPDNVPGYCAHIRYALEMLASDDMFWQSRIRPGGRSRHKVDSDDIGVWADAAGY